MAETVKTDAVVVMDNFGSHHSEEIKKELRKHSWSVLYLPLYSSDLNPIERVWSVFKQKWSSLLMETGGRITEEKAPEAIKQVLDAISPEAVNNLAKNDCQLLVDILEQQLDHDTDSEYVE